MAWAHGRQYEKKIKLFLFIYLTTPEGVIILIEEMLKNVNLVSSSHAEAGTAINCTADVDIS